MPRKPHQPAADQLSPSAVTALEAIAPDAALQVAEATTPPDAPHQPDEMPNEIGPNAAERAERATAALSDLERQRRALEAAQEVARTELEAVASEGEAEARDLDALRATLRAAQDHLPIARAEAVVSEVSGGAAEREHALTLLRAVEQQVRDLPTQIAAAEADLAEHATERAAEQAKAEQALVRLAEQRVQLDVTERALEAARAAYHRQAGQQQMAALKAEYDALGATRADFEEKCADLDERMAAVATEARAALGEYPELASDAAPDQPPDATIVEASAWMVAPSAAESILVAYHAWLGVLTQYAGTGDAQLRTIHGRTMPLSQVLTSLSALQTNFVLTPVADGRHRDLAAQTQANVARLIDLLRAQAR